ncbi:MAG: DUF4350 domain-containing protein [Ekhidna sp.]|uniref:DUF4350 domain-containing protein n=1 Tax=Ekhidna sp. TaxID=2608089 RepID=UPI0032EB5434
MRRGEKKFLIILILLFVVYVATSFLAPKPVDWRVTFGVKDKNPFGAYILNERSQDLFDGSLEVSNSTISEMSDLENLLILSDFAEITGADYRSLMRWLDSGVHVFIAANEFSSVLKDSLSFNNSVSFHNLNQSIFEAATSPVRLIDSTSYEYPFSLVSNYFNLSDTSEWTTYAYLEDNPILISRSFGKGKLILCSTPYIFTNFGLLFDENYQCAAKMLSKLPESRTHFTQFYQLGKGEVTTPFRYFLRQPPLKWSIYVGLFTILVFLIITSRRTQRPIPVITPPDNATVGYVQTLGALFYRERKHKKAAQRLINYFLRDIKERYFLSIEYTEKFYKHLSAKSGVDINIVIQTFELILKVRDLPHVDEKTLIDLSKKIEQFK